MACCQMNPDSGLKKVAPKSPLSQKPKEYWDFLFLIESSTMEVCLWHSLEASFGISILPMSTCGIDKGKVLHLESCLGRRVIEGLPASRTQRGRHILWDFNGVTSSDVSYKVSITI